MFKVLKDWKGSPDGFTVIEYKAGQAVDLVPSLADIALGEGWVERLSAAQDTHAEQAVTKVAVTPSRRRKHK